MLLDLGWGGWLVGWLVCRELTKEEKEEKEKN